METNLKGPCTQCGGLLEFAATDAGAEVECPLCQKTTVLREGGMADGVDGTGGGAKGGRSRKVLLVAASVVLVLSVAGAGAAFYIKQKGGKPVVTEARAAAAKAVKASAPERVEEGSAKMVVPVVGTFQAGLSAAQIREGREVFNRKCYDCHHLYDPSIYDEKQWDSIFGSMRGKAKLSGSEAQAVAVFIKSVREH